jgi:aconitate hydratase
VLSGNRNFEGRINPDVKMNYLASPPLVIAYALAGTMDFDFDTEPLGRTRGQRRLPARHLADLAEVEEVIASSINADMFTEPDYADVFAGDERWQSLPTPEGDTFAWDATRPTCASPRTSTGMPWSPRRSPTSPGPRAGQARATR